MDYTVKKNDIKILDSYAVEKKYFSEILDEIKNYISDNEIECDVMENRSYFSMKMEWACHNFLYNINIKRNKTKDVDLNYPQSTWEKILYPICGILVWLFIP